MVNIAGYYFIDSSPFELRRQAKSGKLPILLVCVRGARGNTERAACYHSDTVQAIFHT